jgi:phage-related protein
MEGRPIARSLRVEIVGDASNYSRALGQASNASTGFGNSLARMGKIAFLTAGAAGVGGLALALKAGISEWAQSAKVAAQTEAVLRSTGGAANVTAKQVDDLAQSLLNKSGIDDEVIKTGENMLLTFSSIRNEVGKGNDVFNQATQAVTDMDVAMTHGNTTQESLAKTAILVGKALNDPVKGATALRRVGVQLTDAQTKQIAAFVKSGDTMKAQKVILAELTKEFGGSAKALGDTMPGALSKLKNNFDNLAGSIVTGLAPAFNTAISGLNTFVSRLSAARGFQAKISVVFDVAKDAFTAVRKKIDEFLFGGGTQQFGGAQGIRVDSKKVTVDPGMVSKFQKAFEALDWAAVGHSIIDGITTGLKTAGNLAKQLASTINDALRGVDISNALKTPGRLAKQLASTINKAIREVDWVAAGRVMGPGLLAAVAVAFSTLFDPVFWAKNWDLMLAVGLAVFGKGVGKIAGPIGKLLAKPFADAVVMIGRLLGKPLADAVLTIGAALERISPKLAEAVVSGLTKLPSLIAAAFAKLPSLLAAAFAPVENLVKNLFGRLGTITQFVVKVAGIDIAINALVQFATGPVWDTIQTAFASIVTAATTALSATQNAVTSSLAAISAAFTTGWRAAQSATTTAMAAVGSAVSTAMATITGAVKTAMDATATAMTTAWNAIKAVTSAVWAAIVAVITGAVTPIKGAVTGLLSEISSSFTSAWATIRGATTSAFNTIIGTITAAAGTAKTAAAAVGSAIVNGVRFGLDALAGLVKSGLDAIWGVISKVAGLVYGAAKAIGSELVHGILDGLGDIAKSVGEKLKSGVEKGLHAIDPRNLKPWSPVSHWGVMLAEELVKEMGTLQHLLGSSLARALVTALREATSQGGDAAVKGMGRVAVAIVAAARKAGVDARAALAVAMSEGGTKFGAVGDKGTSFGPFQLHLGEALAAGMDPQKAAAFANSIQGITFAIQKMAAAGAAGKTGFDAITAIVRGFERPADPSGEIKRAMAFFAKIPAGISDSIKGAGPGVLAQIKGLAALVAKYAPQIGIEHVKGILAGLTQQQPTLLQQARQAMQQYIATAKQAITDARASFAAAFAQLAQQALSAFDEKWAGWVPPAQRLLDKMQLQDQIKQAQDALASAIAQVAGGGAAAAADVSKQLAASIGDAMSTAFGEIAGAKTEAALNKVAAMAQQQVIAAIDAAVGPALAQAQTAVASAQGQLTAAQATGDPEAIAAAQAALNTAVQNQKALDDAVRAQKEFAIGQLVATEQQTHDAIGAKQREGLAKQLATLQTQLAKHPEEWRKMGAKVKALLDKYGVDTLGPAGTRWADEFADGIRKGIPAAVAAARQLAAAVAKVVPHKSPAEEGPLAFSMFDAGVQWITDFVDGVRSVKPGDLIAAALPPTLPIIAATQIGIDWARQFLNGAQTFFATEEAHKLFTPPAPVIPPAVQAAATPPPVAVPAPVLPDVVATANLPAQLETIKTQLAEFPKAFQAMFETVESILNSFAPRMFDAGKRYAQRFADGLRSGIAAIVRAARDLANALDQYVPHSAAEKGPLAFDAYEVGLKWASDLGKGVSDGFGGFTSARLTSPGRAVTAAPSVAGVGGGDVYLTVNMPNYLGDRQAAARELHQELIKLSQWNGPLFSRTAGASA